MNNYVIITTSKFLNINDLVSLKQTNKQIGKHINIKNHVSILICRTMELIHDMLRSDRCSKLKINVITFVANSKLSSKLWDPCYDLFVIKWLYNCNHLPITPCCICNSLIQSYNQHKHNKTFINMTNIESFITHTVMVLYH
jgi:hypothetical protein